MGCSTTKAKRSITSDLLWTPAPSSIAAPAVMALISQPPKSKSIPSRISSCRSSQSAKICCRWQKSLGRKRWSQKVTIHINPGRYFFKGGLRRDLTHQLDLDAPNENPYLIVRSLKNQQGEQKGYPLGINQCSIAEIGDIVKLGRIEYMVAELKTGAETLSNRRPTSDTVKVYELN